MNPPNLALSDTQLASIAQAQRRINLWTGAIRSGKTIASLLRWLMYVGNEAPRSGVLFMVGQTLSALERNVFEPLQDPALFGPLAACVDHTPGKPKATILGREIALVGAKDVRAFRVIRGATGAGAYVDEASLLPTGFMQELMGRLSLPGAKLFATTNPDSPAHWLKRDFIDRIGALDMAHWQFRLDDNPSLTPEYVAATKAEHTGLWYRRMILGEWVAAEGTVYEAWDPDAMTVARMPPVDQWVSVGLDYGTTNPLDAVLLGIGTDPDDKPDARGRPIPRLYAASEWRHDPRQAKRRLTDAEHSRNVRDWLAACDPYDGGPDPGVTPRYFCVDPSAASFIEQLMADRVPGLQAGDNHVVDGIRTVSSLMAADRFRVHDSCGPLLTELPSYSWDDKATEAGEDKPLKVADHAVDALRYGIHTTEAVWRRHVRIGGPAHAAA